MLFNKVFSTRTLVQIICVLVFRPGNSLTKSGEFLENGVSSSGPDEGL
jgi:hypothetical protein